MTFYYFILSLGCFSTSTSALSLTGVNHQGEFLKIVRSQLTVAEQAESEEGEGDGELHLMRKTDGDEDVDVRGAPGTVTALQVPNNAAAFEISGSGLESFNGLWVPSTFPNSATGACTQLTWEHKDDDLLLLYEKDGYWILDIKGQAPSYQAADSGSCAPEDAVWVAVGLTAGSPPASLVRKMAISYGSRTQGGVNTVVTDQVPGAPPPKFVISDAGVAGFNGIYYETPIVVVDQRCERTFAKDGPTNTEYTLAFDHGIWYFASLIGAQATRVYVATDDGSCAPESLVWAASQQSDAPVPTVRRSVASDPVPAPGPVPAPLPVPAPPGVPAPAAAGTPATVPATTVPATTVANGTTAADTSAPATPAAPATSAANGTAAANTSATAGATAAGATAGTNATNTTGPPAPAPPAPPAPAPPAPATNTTTPAAPAPPAPPPTAAPANGTNSTNASAVVPAVNGSG